MREKLGEILIKAGLLDEAGLQRALNEQQRWGGQLGRYLVELGLVSEETLVRALSSQYKLPAVALDPPRLSVAVGRLVPKELCERNNLVCFRADPTKKFLDIAISDPSNADALEDVRVATRCNVRPHIAAPSAIDKAISLIFYGDVTLGNEVDLSPQSTLRDDPLSSELVRKAAIGSSARPSPPALAPLDVQITPSTSLAVPAQRSPLLEVPLPPPAARTVQSLRIAPPGPPPPPPPLPAPSTTPTGEEVHITLDVPAVDKAALAAGASPEVMERITSLEAAVARDNAVLQVLLQALVKRGILSNEDALRILVGKS